MCTHPFLRGGGGDKGGEPPTKFSKRGVGNLQDLIFKRGVGEKKGGDLCEVGGGGGGEGRVAIFTKKIK